MDPLTLEQVRRVAQLARLAIDDAQAERYRPQLGAVLGYMDRLREVDVAGVEPMVSPDEATNRLGGDDPEAGLSNEALRAMAPQSEGAFVRVPKVLDEGGGGA